MKKKFFIVSALLFAISAFSISYTFANTNMVNTVEQAAQNVVARSRQHVKQRYWSNKRRCK